MDGHRPAPRTESESQACNVLGAQALSGQMRIVERAGDYRFPRHGAVVNVLWSKAHFNEHSRCEFRPVLRQVSHPYGVFVRTTWFARSVFFGQNCREYLLRLVGLSCCRFHGHLV